MIILLVSIYLVALMTALFFVARTLWPEMRKPPLPRTPKRPGSFDPQEHLNKLEVLLDEKNKNIRFLQTELKILRIEMRDFGKIKAMLEEEIQRLREQNRIFRSELGMTSGLQAKESQASV